MLRIGVFGALAIALANTLYLAYQNGGGRAIQAGFGAASPLLRRLSKAWEAWAPDWAAAYHVFEGWASLGPLFVQIFVLTAALIGLVTVLAAPVFKRLARTRVRRGAEGSAAEGLAAIVVCAIGLWLPMQRFLLQAAHLGSGPGSAVRRSTFYAAVVLGVLAVVAGWVWLRFPRVRRMGATAGTAIAVAASVGAAAILAGWGLGPHLGWGGAVAAAPAAGPNVLLISIDSLRADHLGSYGYERDTSPHLDRLAARGVRFDATAAPSSWTLPSHMSLMTGLDPLDHGVVSDFAAPLARSIPTLAEAFRAAGYETAGVSLSSYVSAEWGFARGFDHYVDYVRRPPN